MKKHAPLFIFLACVFAVSFYIFNKPKPKPLFELSGNIKPVYELRNIEPQTKKRKINPHLYSFSLSGDHQEAFYLYKILRSTFSFLPEALPLNEQPRECLDHLSLYYKV